MPFSLFTATCASCCLSQWQSFFISWTQYSVNFTCHKWSFVPCKVLLSGLKMVFAKLSQLDVTACIKNCVYNNFNLHYLMSPGIECPWRSSQCAPLPPSPFPPRVKLLENLCFVDVFRWHRNWTLAWNWLNCTCMKWHFMKIKFLVTPKWFLQWFWSLIKLHAFQWPHKLIAC